MLEGSSRGPQAFPPVAPPSPLATVPSPTKPCLRQLLKHQNGPVPTARPRPAALPVLPVQSGALVENENQLSSSLGKFSCSWGRSCRTRLLALKSQIQSGNHEERQQSRGCQPSDHGSREWHIGFCASP